jgi:hypothetical protein
MEISGVASLATEMAATATNQAVSIAVFKKALDAEAAGAAALLLAIPPAPVANLPSHLGQTINTTA